MGKAKETKHEAFLRLMQRRLGRALEELRLVGQLSSPNYENTAAEAEEVITHLDSRVHAIAEAFDVEYATRIGRAKTSLSSGAQHLGPSITKTSVLDEIAIIQVIEKIRDGHHDEAIDILRSAITGKAG